MKIAIFQIINLIIVLGLLGVPVMVTVLLLKYFKDKRNNVDSVDFLIDKINQLEARVKELEDQLDFANIDQ